MGELATEELRQVLHLDFVDLLGFKPGRAGGYYEGTRCIGSHLLLKLHLLLPYGVFHRRCRNCIIVRSYGHAVFFHLIRMH